MNKEKFQGIFPAFYACYDEKGDISVEGVRSLTRTLIDKGVNGLYVGGSSGECIYQSVAERKTVLENVMDVARGKIAIIAHVACNNTADSRELAAHAQQQGVDAIAAIPPIYYKLPSHAIAKYWNDISAAAPDTDMFIYNIPQLTGFALTVPLLREMLRNPRIIGVKNSSMPTLDIQTWRSEGALVFNGPDEQLISGLVIGAVGGIGGTYAVMPQLYLKLYECVKARDMATALDIQNECCRIISAMRNAQCNMYGLLKEILRLNDGINCGSVRAPLYPPVPSDLPIAEECARKIREATLKFCR